MSVSFDNHWSLYSHCDSLKVKTDLSPDWIPLKIDQRVFFLIYEIVSFEWFDDKSQLHSGKVCYEGQGTWDVDGHRPKVPTAGYAHNIWTAYSTYPAGNASELLIKESDIIRIIKNIDD